MTHPETEEFTRQPATEETPSKPDRFPELAELEEEIRRRLRSNRRFLEKFLDEDFVDDESDENDAEDANEEEL